jgi:hypothetical protein
MPSASGKKRNFASKSNMEFTELTTLNTPKWFPFPDASRQYSTEHDIEVHGFGPLPSQGFSASLYDRIQRRWYQLRTDIEPKEEYTEDELKNTLLQHICRQIPFNVMTVHDGEETFSLQANTGRPVRPPIVSSMTLPTADYNAVISKKYHDLSVDTCT